MASRVSPGSAKALESQQPLSHEELRKMHAYWRAANYLSAGQIYLYANPLLQEPRDCWGSLASLETCGRSFLR